MRPAQGNQPAFDGLPPVFEAFGVTQGLRGNRNHRGQRVLHAMMQFLQKQTLQPLGNLMLDGIDPCLCQQPAQIDIFRLQANLGESL